MKETLYVPVLNNLPQYTPTPYLMKNTQHVPKLENLPQHTHTSSHLMKQVQHVPVVWNICEVLVQELVDAGLHQNGIVEGAGAQVVVEVPARFSAPHLAPVYDVVGHQEETLQLWG